MKKLIKLIRFSVCIFGRKKLSEEEMDPTSFFLKLDEFSHEDIVHFLGFYHSGHAPVSRIEGTSVNIEGDIKELKDNYDCYYNLGLSKNNREPIPNYWNDYYSQKLVRRVYRIALYKTEIEYLAVETCHKSYLYDESARKIKRIISWSDSLRMGRVLNK